MTQPSKEDLRQIRRSLTTLAKHGIKVPGHHVAPHKPRLSKDEARRIAAALIEHAGIIVVTRREKTLKCWSTASYQATVERNRGMAQARAQEAKIEPSYSLTEPAQ